ncbi:GNAT family N-acetyltransferase [Octadecabacter ascidiaceicola]|uniref:L-ornithine N(alpha)-acyltransferase n=1 Tax=Octadecabacter ascidiaceicola TaxID=1655543 RepID=A0A238JMQ9_9RHOB|nr:GNAT family N-acetyltransferase [Octadecabacter ascidiaceicola]SMX31931.1 hypothetical protein OCA8868_00572 [Octadecabacter ascidiaceicola]
MAKDTHALGSIVLERGGYVARFAVTSDNLERCQRLRHRCFIEHAGGAARSNGLETDEFDSRSDHVLIENSVGDIVCSFRTIFAASGADLADSYTAQFYGLERLAEYTQPVLELGRFCISSDVQDPDVLRIAWGMIAKIVDARAIGFLFGCSSFMGMDAAPYRDAFALLSANHQAPASWAPTVKSKDVVPLDSLGGITTRKTAMEQLPPLLRTYLSMGGWVSNHAVVDPQMNTLHVFTGLEIEAIPSARAKALRAILNG